MIRRWVLEHLIRTTCETTATAFPPFQLRSTPFPLAGFWQETVPPPAVFCQIYLQTETMETWWASRQTTATRGRLQNQSAVPIPLFSDTRPVHWTELQSLEQEIGRT